MPLSVSQGPRSMPVRTSARGAATRQAPCRHASHISSQEASKATESPARTRSPGPIGSSGRNRRASASTKAAALRWVTATPFGLPVEPDVKMIHASSSRPGGPWRPVPAGSLWVIGRAAPAGEESRGVIERAAPAGEESRGVIERPSPTTARTPASDRTSSARSSGSSASTGTYAAPAVSTPRIAT